MAVIGALVEGSSIRSIERITGVHRDTIMRLGVVGKKDRNVREGENAVGSVWTFCAIDTETKLVPAFMRSATSCTKAPSVATSRLPPLAYRVQVSKDGLNA